MGMGRRLVKWDSLSWAARELWRHYLNQDRPLAATNAARTGCRAQAAFFVRCE